MHQPGDVLLLKLYIRVEPGLISLTTAPEDVALAPQLDIIAPLSPQSIRREPGTSRLWCVYNDRSGVTFGDAENHWGWRTPLTLAYSDDNGESWKKFEQIEDDSHNYCYISMTFKGKLLILTYYESENREDGTRRNLGALKMQTVQLP